jgi:hypothetical protein
MKDMRIFMFLMSKIERKKATAIDRFFVSIFASRRAESRMQHVLRFTAVLAVALAAPLSAEPPDDTSEYKQDDTNFYLKSEVLRANPDAVVLSADAVTDIGGSYLVPAKRHPARIIYLQQARDWIEPITPPNMPKTLDIPPTAMQVRELHGNVEVALPTAPADFHSIDSGTALPDGSVLKTGDNASVAVLFGGVDSVRLAPNSQAAVQMMVTTGHRDAEVDIQDGIVFSKVGQRVGEKESYEVKTPFGTASAHGTDFVTVVLPQRVDVWVAEGTVGLESPIGQTESASVVGNGPFKVMRFPAAPNEAQALVESAESLTAILNFIPMANQKLEALGDRTHDGDKLTPNEKDYISRIRKIPALIKLALVGSEEPPPGPPPAMVPGPLVPDRPVVSPLTAITPQPFTTPKPTTPAKPIIKPLAKSAVAKKSVAKSSESTKHVKPVVAKTVVTSKAKVAKAAIYPRAKPLSPAELAAAEAPPAPPVHVTATKPRVAETSDPNSLGAPLNPYGTPAARNASIGANGAQSAPPSDALAPPPSAPAKPVSNSSNDTVP